MCTPVEDWLPQTPAQSSRSGAFMKALNAPVLSFQGHITGLLLHSLDIYAVIYVHLSTQGAFFMSNELCQAFVPLN